MDIQKNTRRQSEALGFYSMAMVHEFHTGVSLPVVQRKGGNNDNATGIGYKKSKVDKLRICPPGADIFFLVYSWVYVDYNGQCTNAAPLPCVLGCCISTSCSLSVNTELAAQAPKSTQSGYFTVYVNMRVRRVYVLIMWTNGGYLLQYLQGKAIAVCTGGTKRLLCV